MNYQDLDRYFIAIVPPEPILSDVLAIKNHFAEKYQSRGALRSPAHITLHMPFRLKSKKLPDLKYQLRTFAASFSPFDLQINGYDAFEPRVIFLNVINNKNLSSLQFDLAKLMQRGNFSENADYKNRGFHPHMTVAFRDLKKPAFYKAWSEFQNQSVEFQWKVGAISLLHHDGQQWHVQTSFSFDSTQS